MTKDVDALINTFPFKDAKVTIDTEDGTVTYQHENTIIRQYDDGRLSIYTGDDSCTMYASIAKPRLEAKETLEEYKTFYKTKKSKSLWLSAGIMILTLALMLTALIIGGLL